LVHFQARGTGPQVESIRPPSPRIAREFVQARGERLWLCAVFYGNLGIVSARNTSRIAGFRTNTPVPTRKTESPFCNPHSFEFGQNMQTLENQAHEPATTVWPRAPAQLPNSHRRPKPNGWHGVCSIQARGCWKTLIFARSARFRSATGMYWASWVVPDDSTDKPDPRGSMPDPRRDAMWFSFWSSVCPRLILRIACHPVGHNPLSRRSRAYTLQV
jgi:hypothetical protein